MTRTDFTQLRHGSDLLKRGFARMQQGGVIMDVVDAAQAAVAEDAGAVAVMALERVPADIRKAGGVARMSHPDMIQGILDCTSIPVMAKARIGHEGEARILEAMGVDMVDESEVLTPADPFFHINKKDYDIPFVCGATELGEAVRRIHEGAAMIRTKGEAGTGNLVAAVTHSRLITQEIKQVQSMDDELLDETADLILERYRVLADTSKLPGTHLETPFGTIDETMRSSIRGVLDEVKSLGRLPVVTFSAGGIATPADASHMMRMGLDGIFVGSGIFKSDDPPNMADAIVMATAHYDDANKVAEAMAMTEGDPMKGDELETLEIRLDQRGW
ncbi:MAG: pyridoxal 5'-phosphate synthase lyase subunit PdxS [Euryarchaeota archaeon]|nr:pyridoxal 5'-phosphate synthase lyase subunit PdxS [Euryarchaeota archaeon]DAC48597.1 MAG TPA: pyridoxal 5'-phosphate synthase lyase subunit PdxS [Candidatus Poseidoniales archaeon]HII33206.1 pyridoxal 5'-phosphate synthase lyase subunit PdxS [Candidatus Poseidoniaceae archaeon]|tara:strand:+ start:1140 stop:2132 length:993 start_codon:yes stop_codon:yes gene_type:complete